MAGLNDAVAAAVARWREYRELCHKAGEVCHRLDPTSAKSGSTGYVQPAIVTALIEAVTKPCGSKGYPEEHTHRFRCYFGRVPHDWEEMPGALGGVLEHWYWGLSYEIQGLSDYFTAGYGSDDSTLAAVDKAVKEMYGGDSNQRIPSPQAKVVRKGTVEWRKP